MRNIHKVNDNIYITSDKKIKVGDYCISNYNVIDDKKIHNIGTIFHPETKDDLIKLKSCKKIILTTDKDLIKDGVQAIDDEFLEKSKQEKSKRSNMKNKKTTAVEWLIKEISIDRVGKAIIQTLYKEFQQALEMEKEQIINAFVNGEHQQGYEDEAEQYYNENYNN